MLLLLMSKSVLPVFCSKIFILSSVTFRTLIHLFFYMVLVHYFTCSCSVFPVPLVEEETLFSPLCNLVSFVVD